MAAVEQLIQGREQEVDLVAQLQRLQLPADADAMEWRRQPDGTLNSGQPLDSDDSDQVPIRELKRCGAWTRGGAAFLREYPSVGCEVRCIFRGSWLAFGMRNSAYFISSVRSAGHNFQITMQIPLLSWY